MAELNTDELTMMIALGCSADQAHAEYASIEAFLILRDHPVPVGLAVVQADNVNVRAAPSMAAKVLRQHKKGDMLQVWGRTPAGDWLCVVGEPPGWIAANLLKV